MKKIKYILFLLFANYIGAQVVITDKNEDSKPIHSSIGLLLKSNNKGVALPELKLLNESYYPYGKPPKIGSIIFSPNDDVEDGSLYGYFHWDGKKWQKFIDIDTFPKSSSFVRTTNVTNLTNEGKALGGDMIYLAEIRKIKDLSKHTFSKYENYHVPYRIGSEASDKDKTMFYGVSINTIKKDNKISSYAPVFNIETDNADVFLLAEGRVVRAGSGIYEYNMLMYMLVDDKVVGARIIPLITNDVVSACAGFTFHIPGFARLKKGDHTIKFAYKIFDNTLFINPSARNGDSGHTIQSGGFMLFSDVKKNNTFNCALGDITMAYNVRIFYGKNIILSKNLGNIENVKR